MSEEQRITPGQKSEGWTGHDGSADYRPPTHPHDVGGFGVSDETQRPAARDHTKAPGDGHDSQYGASPIRRSRYVEGEGTDAMVDSVPETPPGVPRHKSGEA
ncbi:MAG: hypothetical protein ACXU8O_09465 [Asticcacaulis sp.]